MFAPSSFCLHSNTIRPLEWYPPGDCRTDLIHLRSHGRNLVLVSATALQKPRSTHTTIPSFDNLRKAQNGQVHNGSVQENEL
jgi:hypothetical protein